jgi:polyhydroxyalkanoate synthesis regulator phasin
MSGSNIVSVHRPQHIVSLRSSSVLVALDIKVWTATKQDRAISEEVTHAKRADSEAGKFTQNLLANDPVHKRVINYRQTIYNWLQRRTYEWSGSSRVLPVVDLPKFMTEYDAHKTEFYKLVDEFIGALPTIISDMAFKQGDMFKRDSYPTPEEARGKFSVNLFTSEVPEGDFRQALAQDLADDLHNHYQRQTEDLVNQIISRQMEQFVTVMESLSYTCDLEEVTTATGEVKIKRRKIYEGTLQKALEYCETFEKFNLTANPKLEEARARLSTVLRDVNLDALRESDGMRALVKNEVDDILSRFR